MSHLFYRGGADFVCAESVPEGRVLGIPSGLARAFAGRELAKIFLDTLTRKLY